MDLSRRRFFKAAGAAALSSTAPAIAHTGAAETAGATGYRFLQPREAAFIEAAVARLIPADDLGPGAVEAAVPRFIDLQLAGAWGAGERLYRSGPWQDGTPQQGYQLPFTPAELFRNALQAIDAEFHQTRHAPFDALSPHEQDQWLEALEHSTRDLGGVPAAQFFAALWAMTVEGYFSDPAYGGNRDMVAWRMIGFPGAYADFYALVDQYDLPYRRVPMSLNEDADGDAPLSPDLPADAPQSPR